MWRLFAIICFILICYNYPSSYQNQFLGLDNLRENTARSLYLCVAISLIWTGRSALAIILIETTLILANFYTVYNMPYGGILNGYYATLQQSAYFLELFIMTTFVLLECRKSGANRIPDIYSNLFRSRSDSHRADSSN